MSMTESEAIAIIEDVTWNGCGRHYGKIPIAREMAISALEEVQQLHAIGTVSEFRELKEKINKIKYVINEKHYPKAEECDYGNYYTCEKALMIEDVENILNWSEGKE